MKLQVWKHVSSQQNLQVLWWVCKFLILIHAAKFIRLQGNLINRHLNSPRSAVRFEGQNLVSLYQTNWVGLKSIVFILEQDFTEFLVPSKMVSLHLLRLAGLFVFLCECSCRRMSEVAADLIVIKNLSLSCLTQMNSFSFIKVVFMVRFSSSFSRKK